MEFFTSQLWLGNIYLSWDVVINRIRIGGRTCSLKSFLQLNMCQELQIFAVVYMYSGASYYYYHYYYTIWMSLVTGLFFLVLLLNQQ